MNKNILNIMKSNITQQGLSNIFIGSSLEEFYNAYISIDYYTIVNLEGMFPNIICYTFFDSIDVFFEIISKKLVRIDVYNNYKGKFENKITIGTTFYEIEKEYPNLFYEEDYIMIYDSYDVIVTMANDLSILTDSEITKCKVERISIRISDYAEI